MPTFYNNSDPQICHQCKGLCCQGHPGVWVSPENFFTAFDLPRTRTPDILNALLPKELNLREINGVSVPAPQQTEWGCVFLQDKGCSLPENQRPGQCLALTPNIDTLIDGEIRCELPPEGSTVTAIRNWQAYWSQNCKD